MRNKTEISDYLAFLSTKYEVDPDKLFGALISAGENQKSICEDFLIKCRTKTRDKAVFLITTDSKVVAQFPVPKSFLLQQNNPIKNPIETNTLRRRLIKKNKESPTFRIRDLRHGMKQVCLKAKVQKIERPTLVFTRFGNYASVANAYIEDETGSIKLCLWNEQINSISAGDTIQIESARVSMFRGERQLRIGRNGMISRK